jgi:two-component system CheB/CheR fusion protein
MVKDRDDEKLRSAAPESAQSAPRERRRAEDALRKGLRALEQSEAALRESEARYRAIFDGAAVSLWEEDFSGIYAAIEDLRIRGVKDFRRYFEEHPEFVEMAQGLIQVLAVNDTSVKMFEASDESELLGSLPRIFVPESIPVFIEELMTVAEGRTFLQSEALLATLRGNRIWTLFTMRLRPSAEKPGRVLFSLLDITEKKRAEEELRRTEDRLRFVMDSAPQKIFTARPGGEMEYLSPQWTEFSGMSFKQLTQWGWRTLVHPDDVAENVKAWQHSLETGEPFQFEHRLRRADGEYRWHLSRALPMRNSQGELVLWVGSNTDVHEVKEADRRKNEFLAMLAHELRNPLAPIRNALNVMRLKGGDAESVRAASEMMERQVGQMVRLVDDLLDVSRIDQGRIELRKARIELAAVVSQSVEAARSLVQVMQHDLTITLPSQPLDLDADPARLAQVVGNLLSNACKFTERRGRIRLTVEREGEQAVVRVEDNGIGIAAEQLSRIFDMFMQVDTSLERSVSGLGIGLTLVKKLVEMHGGSVEARSAGVGRGSEFVLRLPLLVETARAPAPGPTASDPASSTPRRILIVDDNRDSAESLALLLGITGNQTQTAYDGFEALETAEKFKPDLVLLDIGLPKLNGYEACRRIRKEPWSQGMMLVALTGWGQEEDRTRASEAGFDGYLVKPVDYADLEKLMASLPSL